MTDHLADLQAAGEEYQEARVKAEAIMADPRKKLSEVARAAYSAGTTKANILRAIGHVWSSTWLDKVLDGIEPPGGRRQIKKPKRGSR